MIEVFDVPKEVDAEFGSALFESYKKYRYIDPKKPLLPNWEPSGCVLTSKYEKHADSLKKFKVRKDDLWIVTYPKAGTTWGAETLWLLENDLDFEKASKVDIMERHLFIELGLLTDKIPFLGFDNIDKLPGKRLIKSHLTVDLLPNELWTVKPKIVYVARNPKDVAVSFYHHQRKLHGFRGTFETYMDGFLQDNLIFGPYFEHVDGFIQLAEIHDNILIVRYEDMKLNMNRVLQTLCKFLDKSYTPEQLIRLENHLKFENMQKLPSSNMSTITKILSNITDTQDNPYTFMRKGKVGSHKEELPEKYSKLIDLKMQKWSRVQNLFKEFN